MKLFIMAKFLVLTTYKLQPPSPILLSQKTYSTSLSEREAKEVSWREGKRHPMPNAM